MITTALVLLCTGSQLCARCGHDVLTPIEKAAIISAKRAGVKEEPKAIKGIILREHGWSITDQSRFSTNKKSKAYGLGQFKPDKWASVGIKKTSCQVCQIEGIYRYCRYRREYGSVSAAVKKWDSRRWY